MQTAPTIELTPPDVAIKTRNAGIDHLRILLTALVILHHVAIVYGGSGGWYWRELENASNPLLVMFNAFNQSFFMGFFFLLSGYYTTRSFEKKGARKFLKDRFLRLGLPLLVYFFLISPFTIALARTGQGHGLWTGWLDMMREGEFEPGPLWFAEALLIFASGYVLWRRLRPQSSSTTKLPNFYVLLGTAIALGLSTFLLRLVIPVGESVLWLQLGYFPCYIYLYAAGCAAADAQLLERITIKEARPWIGVSLIAVICLPVIFFMGQGHGAFEGGWNWNALIYAMWDPLVAWGVILGLLILARTHWSRANRLTAWLAENAYGTFIVHPPVVVGLSLLAASLPLQPLVKFVLVGGLAIIGSSLIASLLRSIPGVKQIV